MNCIWKSLESRLLILHDACRCRLTSDIPSAWKAPVVPRVHPEWHHSGTQQELWMELQGSYTDPDGEQEDGPAQKCPNVFLCMCHARCCTPTSFGRWKWEDCELGVSQSSFLLLYM